MAVLNDYACRECHEFLEDRWSDDVPVCCGKPMQPVPYVNTPEWGGPRQYRTLREEPFSSRSELAKWAKENRLEPAGDKVGGARNEDHRRTGRLYSYKGAPTRGSELAYKPRRAGE